MPAPPEFRSHSGVVGGNRGNRDDRWSQSTHEYAAAELGAAACDHFVGRIFGQRVHRAGGGADQAGEWTRWWKYYRHTMNM